MTSEFAQAPEIPGYRHVRLISDAGGYGDVHCYEDIALGREVAMKVIREPDLSPGTVHAFMAEATAMAALEHPNIVRVYGTGRTTDGRPYIAMQLCPQATLEERASRERLSVAEVLRTGVGIGSAVETAHRAGLLHRDIKPANILTTRWGAPGLTDFGVAAQMSAATGGEDNVGVSPPWSPPEMLYTASQGTASSDVYSLAATLWHLLVGRSPFAVPHGDNSRMAIMSRIRDSPAPPTGRSDVPPLLESMLRRAMSKDPAQRPQTMAEFVEGLRAAEAQLGLPRTEAVYVGGEAKARQSASPAVPIPPPSNDNRTRLRPGLADAGRGAPNPVVADGAELPATQLRPRQADRTGPPESHLGPVTAVTTVEVPMGADPTPSTRSRRVLGWLAAALVIAAGGGAYWLASSGHHAGTAAPVSSPAASGSVDIGPDDVIPPGPVTITGHRSGATVTFSWTYSALLSNDTYRWEVVGGTSGVADKPTVAIAARTSAPVCIHVIVVRENGTFATRQWSAPECA